MIVIATTLESIGTLKDGTIKLTFETQEMNPKDVGTIFSYRNQLGYLAFKPETFQEDELKVIENLKVEEFENEKSDSKRMRNVLYRLWQTDNRGYTDFNLYYKFRMADLIDMLKTEFPK